MYALLVTPKRGGLSAEYLKKESEKKQKVTFFQGLILNVIPLLTWSTLVTRKISVSDTLSTAHSATMNKKLNSVFSSSVSRTVNA